MRPPGRDWRAILLTVGSIGAAIFELALAPMFVMYSVMRGPRPSLGSGTNPVQGVLLAGAALAISLVCLATAHQGIQALRGRASAPLSIPRIRGWELAVAVLIWVGSSVAAQSLVDRDPWKWMTPVFHVLAISVPIYMVLRLALGGLGALSIRRALGFMTTGIVLSTSLAVFLEAILAVVLVITAAVYIAFHPSLLGQVQNLALRLSHVTTVDEVSSLLEGMLRSPLALVAALAIFSGFIPVIEESVKSIGAWLSFDALGTPALGLSAGALAGAGFGLLEGLLASAQPDPAWASTLLIRGGSAMMHITSTGLVGLAIAEYRLKPRFWVPVTGYATAMLIHSLWNASVISLALGAVRLTFGDQSTQRVDSALASGGGMLLLALCILMPVLLIIVNRRLARAPRGTGHAMSPDSTGDSSLPHIVSRV